MATRYPTNDPYEPKPGIRREQPRSARPGAAPSRSTAARRPADGRYASQGGYRSGTGQRSAAPRPQQGQRSAGQRPQQGQQRYAGQRPQQGRRPQPSRRPPQRRRRANNRFYGLLAAVAGILVVLVLVFAVIKPFGRKKNPSAVDAANTRASAQVNEPADQGADDIFAGVEDVGTESQDLSSYSSLNDALGDSSANVGSLAEADMAQVSDLSINTSLPTDWLNVLLLGTDERTLSASARTDSMIICSINRNTGEVKLSSIQRDLAIDYTGLVKKYPGNYRINAANYFGGARLAMKVVNEKFGMNIQYYVMVNFFGFQRIAQQLGGVDIDITEEEMNLINKWARDAYYIAKDSNIDISDLQYEMLETYGENTHLNGTQTLAYARIRKSSGGDYMRAERQRMVLAKLASKVKNRNALEIATMATSMLDQVKTNLEVNDIINTALLVSGSDLNNIKSFRLPVAGTYTEERREKGGAMLWDCDFAANAVQLYNFIYET